MSARCFCLVMFLDSAPTSRDNWLVVSTHLKNISQMGHLPQIGVKIKNGSNHHLDNTLWKMNMLNPRMEVWFT